MTTEDLEQILAQQARTSPSWCMFDHAWYLRAYPDALDQIQGESFEAVRQHYLDHGRSLGHSPNMYFDEKWYLQRYPDVADEIAAGFVMSGYEHYCRIGYVNRSPHWLYDDDVYALYSPDLTDQVLVEHQCFNRYDHYIKSGGREQRIAHLLFDPATYRAFIARDGEGMGAIEEAGPFVHFLRRVWFDRMDATTAVYFDPVWYVEQYEDARAALERRDYACALHHYLASPDARRHDPRPEFSEDFYLAQNPDIAASVRAGAHVSGFIAFLKAGVFALRQPSRGIDLRRHLANHPTARADIEAGISRDAFAHVVAFGYRAEPPAAPTPLPVPGPGAAAAPPHEPARLAASAELPAPAGLGSIDFYGFLTPAHGWMFSGWVTPEHASLDGKVEAIAYFEQGQVAGPALLSTLLREDLGGKGVGAVVYLEGPGRPIGDLVSLSISSEGSSWTLSPAANAASLRDAELAVPLRRVVGQLRANPSKAAITALAGRRGYSGTSTLGGLHDRVFVEIDETIFCPPNGVALIGWMLAKPGVVKAMRLQSGSHSAMLRPEQFVRIDRPDVLNSVGAQHGFQELRNGFMLYVPNVFQPGETSYLEIETARGEIGYRGITEPKLQGMPAMRFLLDRFDVRYDELARVYDNVIGPSVASLNRERLRDPSDHEVIDFGPQPEAPVLSVIVPLYGRLDFMEYQFAFLSRHEAGIAHEIIYVLDDPPRQREAEVLAASIHARFKIPFRLVLLPRNVGYAPANNVGVALARGRYLCFLNSDVFPDSDDWMERLVARLQDNPSLGAVGPLLLFEDRSVQHMGMIFEPLPEFGNWLFPLHERKGWRPPAQRGLRRCDAITGACMVLERRVVRELGGFDESFAIGDFEDSDLCMKLAEIGLECAVDLDVTMFHLERQSQAGSEQRWRMNLTLYNAWTHDGRWGAQIRARQAQRAAIAPQPLPSPADISAPDAPERRTSVTVKDKQPA
ncbi:glycosyltransferase family 2 protein [Limobrevibacterium gyesilva]|uniref:Glycosyltransferase family 2 protein n=1 Tax=Limobrevibacterium gyesilva TaxID=2991712 RepID=A0AA41YQX3_9PROT|nr:glycosyltransferase family 2 protein [Limobrevibacterium gyesilva]MCW3473877.1 glycosyltransferase family 2 protein [Limobrevibacterium gyesilva]